MKTGIACNGIAFEFKGPQKFHKYDIDDVVLEIMRPHAIQDTDESNYQL